MRAMHCVIMFVHPSLTQVHDGARVILGCQDVDVTSIQDQSHKNNRHDQSRKSWSWRMERVKQQSA